MLKFPASPPLRGKSLAKAITTLIVLLFQKNADSQCVSFTNVAPNARFHAFIVNVARHFNMTGPGELQGLVSKFER